MNNNELFDALSGIDPKYIEEAALELHSDKSDNTQTDNIVSIDANKSRNARKASIRKMLYIALPSVAAILLIVGVALPAIMRVSKSESASAPAAAADSATEAPAYDEAAEAEAMPEAVTEAADEAPAATAEATGAASEEPEAAHEYAAEAEEAAPESVNSIAPADSYKRAEGAQSLKPDFSEDNAVMSEAAEEAVPAYDLVLDRAEYKNGILTVEYTGTLPDDIKDMEYTITAAEGTASGTVEVQGMLSDILKDKETTEEHLILDISKTGLSHGTYTLTIGDSSTEFRL